MAKMMDVSAEGQVFTIPAPAVDVAVEAPFFGTQGQYVSGGGYTRKSPYSAARMGVSWNNIRVGVLDPLYELTYAEMFLWNNPMNYRNVALPWYSLPRTANPDSYVLREEYSLIPGYTPSVGAFEYAPTSTGQFPQRDGNLLGIEYLFNGDMVDVVPRGFSFFVPQNMEARLYAVGENLDLLNMAVGSEVIPWSSEPSATYTPLIVGPGTHRVDSNIIGTEGDRAVLTHLCIEIAPLGGPVENILGYAPARGNSGLAFTESGLSLVQHSAALDLQSATAEWLEVGWWL